MSTFKQAKIALDENRMSILGVQVLYGFQLNAPFQPQFASLPAVSKDASLAAFLLLTAAIVVMIAPSGYHRIVTDGTSTSRLQTGITWATSCTLGLLGAAMALDLFLVGERIGGMAVGIGLGIAFALCAFLFWFGIELMHRSNRTHTPRDEEPSSKVKLSERIDFVLTEARVVLPGVQALLGFQLIVVLTDAFAALPAGPAQVHLAALAAVALSAVLLIAPAAHHRIVYRGGDSPDFPPIASAYLLAATVFLALGMAADCYVIVLKVLESDVWAVTAAIVTTLLCLCFWHLFPLLGRYRRRPVHG
ncbi:MAG TPA: DUF6328 family protein [Dongiaceae bacterium]|nr:DUF6328 family protein [Dongiaceae bacterium]